MQILHQRSMRVSRDFQHDLYLRQRDKCLDAPNQRMEPLTGVFKGESWTLFKASMTGQQRRREEPTNVPLLADIDAHIQRCLVPVVPKQGERL